MTAATVLLFDESLRGIRSDVQSLTLASETVTAGELIKERIRHKVNEVQASEACERAFEAFERNGFFMFVGDEQMESLEQRVLVTEALEVRFVKVMPLVGG